MKADRKKTVNKPKSKMNRSVRDKKNSESKKVPTKAPSDNDPRIDKNIEYHPEDQIRR